MLDIPLPAHLKVDLGTAMDCQVPHTLGLLSQQMAWHFPTRRSITGTTIQDFWDIC
jgi:hypothetical protein